MRVAALLVLASIAHAFSFPLLLSPGAVLWRRESGAVRTTTRSKTQERLQPLRPAPSTGRAHARVSKLAVSMSGFEPPFVAAIDEGTQSCRFLVFDKKGKMVAKHQEEKKQIYPQPGWCEHDPAEIVGNVNKCIEKTSVQLTEMGYSMADIKGIGITNQRETTVVWDKTTGEPLHNAVVWLDTRTQSTCEELAAAHGGNRDVFRDKCGLPISTYFSAVKLKWLLDNVPEVRAKADAGEALFGTIDSWLLYKLGGVHVTDVTNAARTMLMDLKTLTWDPDLCKAFGIPMSMLPEIRSSAEVYSKQSAMVGHAAFNKGDSKNTYGTGCFMLLNTGQTPVQSKAGLLTTVCYKLGPDKPAVYALEGSVAIAGVGVSWLKNNMNLISSPQESEELARSVEDTAGVYFVPAFSGLFAPYWREDARGVIVGLTQYTTRAHIVRSMLEAVAYQNMDVVDAMVKDSGVKFACMKVDGGMTANEVLIQFQADILDTVVMRPSFAEITAFGSALAAGLATGVWASEEEATQMQKAMCEYTEFAPSMPADKRQQRRTKWADAIQRSFNQA